MSQITLTLHLTFEDALRAGDTDDIVVLMMSDYGLDLYGNVIIANPDFMKFNPKAVAGFVRAPMRGIQDA